MSGIFISYRRDDAAGWVGRLAADLRREFPADAVFQDIVSIGIGENFVEAMRRALASCVAAVVVIGPRWLDATDEGGNRRLDDPGDWVRLEVEESLRRPDLLVVPVRVGGAAMPKAAGLPEPLRPLALRNALEITDERWDYDVARLVTALRKVPALALGGSPASGDTTAPVAGPGPRVRTSAAAGRASGTVFRDRDDGPEMVAIAPGTFMMGSPASEVGRFDNEGPRHKVKIAYAFALGRHPVTVGEFGCFVAATGYRTEAEVKATEGIVCVSEGFNWVPGRCWRHPGFAQDDRHPVVGVSWHDAQAYLKWLRQVTGQPYRLPSEAEWEYAARAGSATRFPWGDEPGTALANFNDSGTPWSGERTSPVGSFPANAFGLHDMIGNVWEWVQDCWSGSYRGAPADGRAWESGDCDQRVLRGGAWNMRPSGARTANRNRRGPGERIDYAGVRVARSL